MVRILELGMYLVLFVVFLIVCVIFGAGMLEAVDYLIQYNWLTQTVVNVLMAVYVGVIFLDYAVDFVARELKIGLNGRGG